ncbi:hypothetical protein C2I36_03905 [Rhodobacteraceae bacterium WD3A24]|nr:hypothetical protein C2I36_03905 [Rhodobacteraceae bacterium WD3A24]
MKRHIQRFGADEHGAVTVDWVVLTAAIVGIGVLVLVPIAFGAGNLASSVGSTISDTSTGYSNQN